MCESKNNNTSHAIDIEALLTAHHREVSLSQYNAGLKALLDVLPENTEDYPSKTIDHYLWVIELLLTVVYAQLAPSPAGQQPGPQHQPG